MMLNVPYYLYVFSGYSMYPLIRPGDRIIVKKMDWSELHTGDVIALKRDEGPLVIHRLIRMFPQGEFLTKGDALPEPDPATANPSQVLGRVEFLIRKRRFIPVSSGPRPVWKRCRAFLSLAGIVQEKFREKIGRIGKNGGSKDPKINRSVRHALL